MSAKLSSINLKNEETLREKWASLEQRAENQIQRTENELDAFQEQQIETSDVPITLQSRLRRLWPFQILLRDPKTIIHRRDEREIIPFKSLVERLNHLIQVNILRRPPSNFIDHVYEVGREDVERWLGATRQLHDAHVIQVRAELAALVNTSQQWEQDGMKRLQKQLDAIGKEQINQKRLGNMREDWRYYYAQIQKLQKIHQTGQRKIIWLNQQKIRDLRRPSGLGGLLGRTVLGRIFDRLLRDSSYSVQQLRDSKEALPYYMEAIDLCETEPDIQLWVHPTYATLIEWEYNKILFYRAYLQIGTQEELQRLAGIANDLLSQLKSLKTDDHVQDATAMSNLVERTG